MLSFDCHPAYVHQDFFRPQRFDPFESLFGFAPSHPAHHHAAVQHPHANHRSVRSCRPQQPHRHAQRTQRRTEPITIDLFNMLEEQKPQRPKTYAKIFNGKNTFKIVVGNTADYKTYSIHYKVSDRTLIIVESEEEDFQKIYSFANGSIDLDNITWELVENSLVVHIPKAKKSDFVLHPSVPASKAQQTEETAEPEIEEPPSEHSDPEVEEPEEDEKEVKKVEVAHSQPSLVEKPKTSKPRVISIKIDFEDSDNEEEVPLSKQASRTESLQSRTDSSQSDNEEQTSLQSESESEVESKVRKLIDQYETAEQPSPKLPKLTRKVSIEEVEDESFQQMDLD